MGWAMKLVVQVLAMMAAAPGCVVVGLLAVGLVGLICAAVGAAAGL